jgi:hypothetical protein
MASSTFVHGSLIVKITIYIINSSLPKAKDAMAMIGVKAQLTKVFVLLRRKG